MKEKIFSYLKKYIVLDGLHLIYITQVNYNSNNNKFSIKGKELLNNGTLKTGDFTFLLDEGGDLISGAEITDYEKAEQFYELLASKTKRRFGFKGEQL